MYLVQYIIYIAEARPAAATPGNPATASLPEALCERGATVLLRWGHGVVPMWIPCLSLVHPLYPFGWHARITARLPIRNHLSIGGKGPVRFKDFAFERRRSAAN